ncbi:RNA polymerase factor sigma-70 [Polystyrenella longa]|uniref:RNA polymerase factor sigma-70 n=2 Tax=Polystyrenella longa TaxID=2528007 RepID=A0A518CLQ7_9PLAN|nr:RNA polymerase factor sigma-70 [Polystyrenella longa]
MSVPYLSNQFDTTDNKLLQRAQVNSQESWRVLIEAYTPLVYQIARKCGLQPSDASDVTQNVLMELTRSLGNFHRRNHGSFRKWLRVVTTSKVNNYFIKQKSLAEADQKHALFSNLNGVSLPPPTEAEHTEENPQPLTDRQFKVQMVLNQVQGQVSAKTWQAFELMIAEVSSSEEIGLQLGMTADAVRMAKRRVLKRFQDLWEEQPQQ